MKTKQAFLLAIVALTVLSWITYFQNQTDRKSTYEQNLKEAVEYEEKGFYVEAIRCYKAVLELEPENSDIQKSIALDYYQLGESEQFIAYAVQALSQKQGDLELCYALARQAIKENDVIGAFHRINDGLEQNPDNTDLLDLYDEIKGQYVKTVSGYAGIRDFNAGYSIGLCNDSYNIINQVGEIVAGGIEFTELADYFNDGELIYSAKKDDKWSYYDTNSYLRVSPEKNYDYLGTIHDGKILVCLGNKWGYLNSNFEEEGLDYENATAFINQVAAVKKNEKWALIDSDLNQITDYVYDDVVLDDWNVCAKEERIWVQKGEQFCLLDKTGEIIAEGYEDAKGFFEADGLAAVKKSGKWGLINKNGELILNCTYEELNSSSEGLVAFREGELWGYMSEKGEIMIPPTFLEAKCFNSSGYAPVRGENGWYMIQLKLHGVE